MNDQKIIDFEAAFARLHNEARPSGASPYVGFSDRLNVLIDNTTINPPALDKGRATWLAGLTGASTPTVGAWLKQDTVPAFEMLDLIARFIISHQTKYKVSPQRLKSWLLFGDETINPLTHRHNTPEPLQPYIPLAMTLISEVVKSEQVERTAFDLGRVLNYTASMLENLNITDMSQIEDIHRSLVSQCLKLYLQ